MDASSISTSSQAMLENLERMKRRNQERLAEIVRSYSETSMGESHATTASIHNGGGSNNSNGKASIQTLSTAENTYYEDEHDEDDDDDDIVQLEANDNVSRGSGSTGSSSLMNPYFGVPASGVPAWFSSYMAQQEARQQLVLNKLNLQKEEIDRLQNTNQESPAAADGSASASSSSQPLSLQFQSPIKGGEEKKEVDVAIDSEAELKPLVVTKEDYPSTDIVMTNLSALGSEISKDESSSYEVVVRKRNLRTVFRKNTTTKTSDLVRNADEISTKQEDAKDFLEKFHNYKKKMMMMMEEEEEAPLVDEDEQDVSQSSSSPRQQEAQSQDRLLQIQREMERTGTYEHTTEELEFGCRLAWKNAARCNARQHLEELQVRDSRFVSNAKDCFDDLVKHLKASFNDGMIRPMLTIYRPKEDGQSAPVRIWNRQLLGYAAYELADGKILGDPMNLQFTALCQKFGWTPPKVKTDFDILPLLISDASTGHHTPQVFEIPFEDIPEVRITHPEFDLFEMLGLRCYSMPCSSNMGIEIGGVHYQTACFSRWYQVTEIGRQFLDPDRYNLVETIAVACDISRDTNNSLWKNAAQMELHKAILYSFEEQSIPCVDHYKASENFVQYYDQEMKQHGKCPAHRASLLPPAGGSMTAVYHRKNMVNQVEKPRYRRQMNIWEDLQMDLPDPLVVDSVRGISRSFAIDKESSVYDKVLIFHASEFGKALRMATMIACEFGTKAKGPIALNDLPPLLLQHSDDTKQLSQSQKQEKKTLAIIVASTNKLGDAPESAKSFVDQMKRIKNHSVRNVDFSLLALGNSAYQQSFAAFGQKVVGLLERAGCAPALNMQISDELNDPQAALDSFTKLMLQVYAGKGKLGIDLGVISSRPPAFATISLDARTKMLEMSSGSNRRDAGVLHHTSSWANRAHKLKPSMDMFTFKLDEGYESLLNDVIPGDLVALYPSNLNDIVELVFRNANHSARSVPREYLKSNVDLSRPLKSSDILELGKIVKNEFARETIMTIVSQSSQESNPSIEQLVQMLPPGSLPMEWVVRYGPPMDPRFFSIADVNFVENSVSFMQTVYTFESNKKAGLASRWLRSLRKGEKTRALFVASSFHAPSNRDVPLLLFATDSGIASFHSLWQPHCRNPLYLFYTCKNPAEIAFRSNISDLKAEGRLKPYIAYSHVKQGKMDMHELILRARDVLLKRIHNKKGIIYLSGPPEFERTVRNALVTVLAEGNGFFPGLGTVRAMEYLSIMTQNNRFFFQVYGKPTFAEDPTLVLWQEAVAKTVRTVTKLDMIGLPRGRTDDTFALDSDFMGSFRVQSGKRYNPKVVSNNF